MSMPEALFHQPRSVPLPRRAVAYAAVGAARLLATQPPGRIRAVLGRLHRDATPATFPSSQGRPGHGGGGEPTAPPVRAAWPGRLPPCCSCRLSGRWVRCGAPGGCPRSAPTPGWRPRADRWGRTTRPTTSAPSSPALTAVTDRTAPFLVDAEARRTPPARRVNRQLAWRLLLAHVGPHRWTLLGGGLLGFLGGLAALAQPLVAKLVIDRLGAGQSPLGPVVLLTVLTIGGALLTAAGNYVLGRTAESVVLTARQRLISQPCGCGLAPWTGSSRATCSPGSPPTPPCCAASAPTGWSTRSTRPSCWSPRSSSWA